MSFHVSGNRRVEKSIQLFQYKFESRILIGIKRTMKATFTLMQAFPDIFKSLTGRSIET